MQIVSQMAKPEPSPNLWQRVERARDFIVLSIGAMSVLAILAMLGALGWIEALTGSVVIGAGALAFYAGTSPYIAPLETADEAAASTEIGEMGIEDVLAALPLPAMIIDADGRISVINERAKLVFRSGPEPGGLAMTAIRHPELLHAMERVTGGHAADPVVLAFPRETDEVWKAQVARLPRTGDILVILKDQTAIRHAERARADFLANASHELRTPLTSLAGFIETMQGAAKDDKESWDSFLEIMQSQTERMRRLIDDLLSLSRIELSEHKPPRDEVDMSNIVAEMVEAMRPVALEQGVSVRLTGPDDHLKVIAVRDELMQVVQNLVDNARKYSPRDGEIDVSFGTADNREAAHEAAARVWPSAERMHLLVSGAPERAAWVWLRVEDQGEGIARQHLARLGERFYRADESRGGEIEGTGLGLAIVKHIMTRHKGGLAVESEVGKGAAFGIWLPLVASEKDQSQD